MNIYDQFPALPSILQDTPGDDLQDEHQDARRAYQILSPAFEQAAEWLKMRVDPAQCFAHFMVAESEMTSDSRTQDEPAIGASHVTKRLSQLRDEARSDRHFPFALIAPSTVRHDDGSSVTFSGDLHVVTAVWRRYFHVVGTNYFSGRVAPSLSPGQVEVFGVIHVDVGGHMGRIGSESDANAAEMVFDVRERWRRSKRQRQVNVALNSSDFYGREYVGFGRLQVQQAVVKLKQDEEKNVEANSLQHPCFSRGHASVVDGVNMTLEGSGNANECMVLLRSHIAASNVNCPPGNFCFLGSAPQPQGFGSFYASGVLRQAVLSASRVLKHMSNKQDRTDVNELQLPAPSLLKLRNAAKNLCALPYTDVEAGAAPPHLSASDTTTVASVMEWKIEPPSALCFDLCYTIVLLEKIGVQDNDERVHFVDRFEKEPVSSEHGSMATIEHDSPSELVAWLTGAFLYLEALQRKVAFSMESELLAEQLSAGLPLGWNMTLLVFVAACVYLYLATGPVAVSGRVRRGSSGYVRVVNGGTKTKYKDTTQSIQFVDDARD
ncbi:hypothetical protein DD238_002741 [Peronospora effusa]|uniref:Uncharacterized protein n=1 Tax=Peronospora effusa TaxID=542832 RepID=A0A3M6VRX9_9STRA|nr:hypothetical protein DD238_002741 [Peronospora effusa]RQM14429.1 hypothetical protein DD237_005415 [Peronospora effusa]